MQDLLIKADRGSNQGLQTGRGTKEEFFEALDKVLPCKTKDRMEELQQALFFDCGGPVRKVNYIDVFQDDNEGNQGKFVEGLRDQYLDEAVEYAQELSDALLDMAAHGGTAARAGLNVNQMREAILTVDPQKSLGEVDEYIARAYGLAHADEVEDLKDSFRVPVGALVRQLRSGLLKRTTPPGMMEEDGEEEA